MFDILELDEMIFRWLSQHDLAQCARVSKKWHTVVIPYLWRDLKYDWFQSVSQKSAFRELVLEDYLREQEHQELQGAEHGMGNHIQVLPSSSLSSLAKYCPWIRELPDPNFLLHCLGVPANSTRPQQAAAGQDNEPTPIELLRHLYKRCPSFQVQELSLLNMNRESDEFLKTIAELVFPRVRSLEIHVDRDFYIPSWRLKQLLDHCSSTLEELTLGISVSYDGDDKDEGQDLGESTPWTNLRRLNIHRSRDKSDSKAFWSWLWKRCGQVEQLRVPVDSGIAQSFAAEYMPNLSKIILRGPGVADEEVVTYLSSSLNGFKEVEIHGAHFRDAPKKALMKHCSTLERLTIDFSSGISSDDILQVLSCSPHLHTLHYDVHGKVEPPFLAETFIDHDPDTGLLRTWACEATLEKLEVNLVGIPRPDLWECKDQEAYLDTTILPSEDFSSSVLHTLHLREQGRKIQSQVYDRLARLTNLETLWLGRIYTVHTDKRHLDCLEMSLESGLHKLSGLKAFKELSVSGMWTKIGVEEVQWMTEQWPNLRIMDGLRGRDHDHDKEAVKWLRKNRPDIRLTNRHE